MAYDQPICPKCKGLSHLELINSKLINSTGYSGLWQCQACGTDFIHNPIKRNKMVYLVIAKPGTVDYHNPSKTYETKAQALEVAKSMAQDKQKTYCVVKVIAEARISKVEVEEFE